MAKVLIVYASDYGSTKKMADAIADGVKSIKGAEAVLKTAEDTTAEDMTSSDALIFGSPVHMGSPDWRIKKLIDEVCSGLWMKDALQGKVGAVFVTGSGFGNAGGGAELTLLSMLSNFAELGLVIVPFPKSTPGYPQGGIQWGPYGRSADENLKPTPISDDALGAAERHGANVARAAQIIKGQKIFG